MRRKNKRYTMVTPAFLGARRRKEHNENTLGRVFPLEKSLPGNNNHRNSSVNIGDLNENGDADYFPLDGLEYSATPALQRKNSASVLSAYSRLPMSVAEERRAYSAPASSYKHMASWTLPPKVCTKVHMPSPWKPQAGLHKIKDPHSKLDKPVDNQNKMPRLPMKVNSGEKSKEKAQKYQGSMPELKTTGQICSGSSQRLSHTTRLQYKDAALFQRMNLNRTRVQTWHRLPVYPSSKDTINVSSMYMRPHMALPNQFSILPEWGMC